MAHSTDADSDFVSTAVPNSSSSQSETSELETSTTESDEYDDESDEEIYVKKRTGDRKYVEGVINIKEAKRKRNSGDNRAAIKKQKTVKEQKTVKDILKELPSINTRSTPGLMTDVVSSLTSEQKDWVKRMGFKAFLKINIRSIPLKLCHFVLKHYDKGTNSNLIKGKRIKITKEKIHKVFGLPKTGKSLFDLDKLIYCDEIEYKLQKIERKTPLVTMWTADKLKERQSFEIEAGGFVVGNLIEQSSNLEREKNENQVNENQDTRIEEYEKNFNNVSTEKNDMEDIIFHCLSKFPEDNRAKEMIRKFRDIFSTTLFSSREKSETIKERTEVKADRDEELNKTNISDSDDDKDEGMNTKLVAFLAVKPLQQKFPENEETQEEDQDMNVYDRINLGFENNIGEETIRHPHNPERQIEFEGINVDDKINLALEVNNIDETIGKKNLEDNVERKNLVKGGEMIGGGEY
ncbi:unnamed protein product [Lactuca saligna]|uniref:Uncharacterized protein n=1 Tax=Lactuca saligna TaxID=75948 RepID=A0AA36E0E1_LACSI|nr:unnamed protein product [Lactuca saligna]